MTAVLKPHPDGEGCTCAHCDAEESSLWRPAHDGTGYVCRCNDCWRDEGWLPPKKKRGRKSKSDPGADIDLVMLPAGTISGITKIEAQRCAPHDSCPCIAPHDVRAPTARDLCVLRFCDPTHLPVMHEQRRIAALQNDPEYLVLGIFRGQALEDPGFPDKRWLTLDVMRATLEVAAIQEKIEEYEAASKAARVAKLAATPTVSPES